MKLFSMFAGYGTDSFALKRLGIEHECVGFSEIDKYAIQCFKQNHGEIKNFGDCTKINPAEIPDFDLLTGGFPCQAFSTAGKMLGELDARGTLFNEIIRIAELKQPKYMLLENVKSLTSKRFKGTFDKILSELNRIGYNVYWKVLNSKDYGIPQSRSRVWFVCFRKDIDKGTFQFPNPVELKIFIENIVEEDVDEKYYLTQKQYEKFKDYDNQIHSLYPRSDLSGNGGHGHLSKSDGIAYCIDRGNMQFIDVYNKKFQNICPALTQPNHNSLRLYESFSITNKNRGKKPYKKENREMHLESNGKISFTVKSALHEFLVGNKEFGLFRKLTPKECFKLMGFSENQINLDRLSDNQQYKLAGNGQDINVVSLIFKEMFKK